MTALLSSTVFGFLPLAHAQQATPLRGTLQDNSVQVQAQNDSDSNGSPTANPTSR